MPRPSRGRNAESSLAVAMSSICTIRRAYLEVATRLSRALG
jgi:hypothetical protein